MTTTPISLTSLGTAYTQDFNKIGTTIGNNNSLPTGWQFLEAGTGATASYTVNNGSTATGNTYNYGTTSNTDRALGTLRLNTGDFSSTIGVAFTNNTGSVIESLVVQYTGEQWRVGANTTDYLDFQYSVDANSLNTGTWSDFNSLDFKSPTSNTSSTSRNGDLPQFRTTLTQTITGLNIQPNATFYFRWLDNNLSDPLAEHGLAVDDFSLTPTVAQPNNPPTAGTDNYSLDEDNTFSVTAAGVLTNDTEPDGDTPLTVVNPGTYTTTKGGSITLSSDGAMSYTPAPDYFGTDSYTYTVADSKDATATGTINFDVASVNDAPDAVDDEYTVNKNNTLTVPSAGVLTNDSDADEDSFTVSGNTQPNSGTVSLNPDGSFVYTPTQNFNGTDSFTYNVTDSKGASNSATVTITVTNNNNPPTAVDDPFYTTNEDTPLSVTGATNEIIQQTIAYPVLLSNDTDLDQDNLTVSSTGAFTTSENGTVTLYSDGSFDYQPAQDFNGVDSFNYTASDGNGGTSTATATVTVLPVNDAPTAVDDEYTTKQDQLLNVSAGLGVRSNDVDVDGDTLTISLGTDVSDGTLALNTDGSFTYNPDPGFYGTDSFTYTASDGSETSGATVTITVNELTAPVANNDSYVVFTGTTLSVNSTNGVLSNDTDPQGDDLTVTAPSSPYDTTNGTVSISTNGSFTYTPDKGFAGTDSFTYTVSDGAETSSATVTFNVVNGISGNGYNNKIKGSTASDYIDGQGGNDTIFGYGGDDTLIGGTHNDSLIGGAGNDVLTGGSRMDTFVFTNEGTDTVTDFNGLEGDVFAFQNKQYTGLPATGTPMGIFNPNFNSGNPINSASMVTVAPLDYITTTLGSAYTNTRLAFDTTNSQLLYDANGKWSDGYQVVANVTFAGGFTSANFAGNDFRIVNG
jgi:VCBS repeat-containing protein